MGGPRSPEEGDIWEVEPQPKLTLAYLRFTRGQHRSAISRFTELLRSLVIIRRHRRNSLAIPAIATDTVAWSVSRLLCMHVTLLNHVRAIRAHWKNEMPFSMHMHSYGPRNIVLARSPTGRIE